MKQRVPVSEIMSKDLVTLTPNQSLEEAEKLFKDHNIRHVPIVEGDRLVGVLSHTDLLRISFSELDEENETVVPVVYDMYTIPQVMTKTPVSVEINATIKETVEILSKQSFHSLPVVDNEKLVGIITTTDLLNYMLAQY